MDGLPPLYVINLDRSTERLRLFRERNAHVENIVRISGIDGRTLDREALLCSGYITRDLPYGAGTLGSAMSHLKLWEMAASQDQSITIFEDDVVISHSFAERARKILASVPEDWDLIQWGYRFKPSFLWVDFGVSKARLHGYGGAGYEGTEGLRRLHAEEFSAPLRLLHSFGIHGYSISAKGARAALEYCLPLRKRLIRLPEAGVTTWNTSIDIALCGLYPTLEAFLCTPPLLIECDNPQSDRKEIDKEATAAGAAQRVDHTTQSAETRPGSQVARLAPVDTLTLLVHPRTAGFLDSLVLMLAEGLRQIRIEPELRQSFPSGFSGRAIIMGANFYAATELASLASNSIIFNVENTSSVFLTDDYRRFLRRFTVWDFSEANANDLSKILSRPVHYLKMFYVESLSRIVDAGEHDIDVLFYGSFNERRSKVLNSLRARGLRVKSVFLVFGLELDRLIARSKVVINIHFYDNGHLELIRIFDLLANRRAVVSELNPGELLDADLRDAFIAVPYEHLVDATEALVHDPDRRDRVARAGFDAFSRRRAGDILREALAWSQSARLPAEGRAS